MTQLSGFRLFYPKWMFISKTMWGNFCAMQAKSKYMLLKEKNKVSTRGRINSRKVQAFREK